MIAIVSNVSGVEGLFLLNDRQIAECRPALRDKSLRLDHVGIAVRSIASSRLFYEALGLHVIAEETVEQERVRTAMLPLGESRLELIEPMDADSSIGRFLAKRGEGMHHIALHCDDICATFDTLRSMGMRLASDSVRVGAGGHRYFFVHPASTGGVLVEIVGDPAQAGKRETD